MPRPDARSDPTSAAAACTTACACAPTTSADGKQPTTAGRRCDTTYRSRATAAHGFTAARPAPAAGRLVSKNLPQLHRRARHVESRMPRRNRRLQRNRNRPTRLPRRPRHHKRGRHPQMHSTGANPVAHARRRSKRGRRSHRRPLSFPNGARGRPRHLDTRGTVTGRGQRRFSRVGSIRQVSTNSKIYSDPRSFSRYRRARINRVAATWKSRAAR